MAPDIGLRHDNARGNEGAVSSNGSPEGCLAQAAVDPKWQTERLLFLGDDMILVAELAKRISCHVINQDHFV